MSWLADTPPGAQQVIEYEAVLNQLFRNVHGLGMCQYDRKRLPAIWLISQESALIQPSSSKALTCPTRTTILRLSCLGSRTRLTSPVAAPR